jgi:hypothetical protein
MNAVLTRRLLALSAMTRDNPAAGDLWRFLALGYVTFAESDS